MAAETWLSIRGQKDQELARADQHARDAVRLADPTLDKPLITADEVPAINSQSEGILRAVERRRAGVRQARRGKQELIAGSFLIGVAALGAGVAIGGSMFHRNYHRRVDPIAGMEELYDLAPLKERYDLGSSMIAAGALMMIGGAILGATLTGIGARDLRMGRRFSGQRAELRVAPAFGGLSLSGRF